MTVTGADGCTAASAPLHIELAASAPAVVLVAAAANGCVNQASSVTVGNASEYTGFAWTVTHALNVVPEGASVGFTPDGSGDVVVTVDATTASSCAVQKSLTVPVLPTPAAPEISAPGGVCPGSGYNATVPASYAAYSWSITNGFATLGTTGPQFSFQATDSPVVLSVTVTDANGCSVTATKSVTRPTLPAAPVTSNATAVCAGTLATASTSPFYFYQWFATNAAIVGPSDGSSITYRATVLSMVDRRDRHDHPCDGERRLHRDGDEQHRLFGDLGSDERDGEPAAVVKGECRMRALTRRFAPPSPASGRGNCVTENAGAISTPEAVLPRARSARSSRTLLPE